MMTVTTSTAAWTLIALSGLLEVAFALSMKLSEGFSRPVPALVCVAAGIASVWLMSLTLKVLPVGTAYAVWAGIGAAGTALVGIVVFGESASLARIISVGLVVAGIIALQLQGVE